MQRNECQDHITQDAYGVQYLNSALSSIHATREDLWGLFQQQSICGVNSSAKNIHSAERGEKKNKKEKFNGLRGKHCAKSEECGVQ